VEIRAKGNRAWRLLYVSPSEEKENMGADYWHLSTGRPEKYIMRLLVF